MSHAMYAAYSTSSISVLQQPTFISHASCTTGTAPYIGAGEVLVTAIASPPQTATVHISCCWRRGGLSPEPVLEGSRKLG